MLIKKHLLEIDYEEDCKETEETRKVRVDTDPIQNCNGNAVAFPQGKNVRMPTDAPHFKCWVRIKKRNSYQNITLEKRSFLSAPQMNIGRAIHVGHM